MKMPTTAADRATLRNERIKNLQEKGGDGRLSRESFRYFAVKGAQVM
jgi:hypothetical protein